MSKGLDIGTMNLVVATQQDSTTVTKRLRDAFLDLPKSSKKLLKLSGADFVETEEEILILGDNALEMANMFGKTVRRPLSKGLVSPSEINAMDVLAYMIKSLLGSPTENEVCYYSIPAKPIDNPSKDTIYHKRLFERIISDLGYKAIPSNEAMAIIFSECSNDKFSGLSLSFGSGMTNIALANLSIECMSFSVERGGDWIDHGASLATGATQASICLTKENGVDLLNPKNRIEEAISFYYKELIEYSITAIVAEFQKKSLQMVISKPIPIVVSGGTSLAGNFLNFFEKVVRSKKLPFEISEIRQAKDPYNSVALGLLIQAMQEE
jgi:hypothetical protein